MGFDSQSAGSWPTASRSGASAWGAVTASTQQDPADGSVSNDSAALDREFPPMVYVPCSPAEVGSREVSVDVWPAKDGRTILLVYSALDRLVDGCGPEQAWVVLPATVLEQVRLAAGFELVLLDLVVPEEFRRTAGSAE